MNRIGCVYRSYIPNNVELQLLIHHVNVRAIATLNCNLANLGARI